MKQLDLFETQYDPKKEMEAFRTEWDKTRKSLYAKHGELVKMYNELAHEHMILKLNICRGKIV